MKKVGYLCILCVFISSVVCWPEIFSAIGKYDAGQGGILLPGGVETLLVEQEGPGYISHFQFAADEFTGYSDVRLHPIFLIFSQEC